MGSESSDDAAYTQTGWRSRNTTARRQHGSAASASTSALASPGRSAHQACVSRHSHTGDSTTRTNLRIYAYSRINGGGQGPPTRDMGGNGASTPNQRASERARGPLSGRRGSRPRTGSGGSLALISGVSAPTRRQLTRVTQVVELGGRVRDRVAAVPGAAGEVTPRSVAGPRAAARARVGGGGGVVTGRRGLAVVVTGAGVGERGR